jgi:D-alanine-D-alanine ligase
MWVQDLARAGDGRTELKICVLQPSYEGSDLLREHATLDPPRDLSHLAPEWRFTNLFLRKQTVSAQLREASLQGYDVFVNLCEGHLKWDVPSIDVIHALDSLGLPYTGPPAELYEPRKEKLKLIACQADVASPPYVLARSLDDVAAAAKQLAFPQFVKPNEGGDSWGIDSHSLCVDAAALAAKSAAVLAHYEAILIEEFLPGREFSVLVAADPCAPALPLAFRPIEFRFPPGERFKTYDLKNAQYHPELNVGVAEADLEAALMDAARRVFRAFDGRGYCRMDFRLDAAGVPNIIDANFTCSVFYAEGHYGTADYILQHDGYGTANFLRHIVGEGIDRHAVRSKVRV